MSAHLNRVRRVWDEGRVAVNGWIASPAVITAEAMAVADWDALTVDLQHGTADYASLLSLFPVIEKAGTAPMVRVPWLDEGMVMRALDAGALGIIAPMTNTPADAARLVSACRYPPEGGRSFGPIRARYAWGNDYPQRANREVLCFAMVETRAAVDALDAIISVPGLDGIYVGPSDLALSYGFPPGFDRQEPEMEAIIMDIFARCRAANVRCCLHTGSPDYAAIMAAKGFSLVTIGSDVRLLEAAATATVAAFRKTTAR